MSMMIKSLPSARRHHTGHGLPLTKRLTLWMQLSRQRRRLAALDDAQLLDIGLTRQDADHEAQRPFWDAPQTWTK